VSKWPRHAIPAILPTGSREDQIAAGELAAGAGDEAESDWDGELLERRAGSPRTRDVGGTRIRGAKRSPPLRGSCRFCRNSLFFNGLQADSPACPLLNPRFAPPCRASCGPPPVARPHMLPPVPAKRTDLQIHRPMPASHSLAIACTFRIASRQASMALCRRRTQDQTGVNALSLPASAAQAALRSVPIDHPETSLGRH
jgi:hypothetical protein